MSITINYPTIVATVCVAALGWWVVHMLTQRRDQEKFRLDSLKSDIEDIISLIDEISIISNEYHSTDRNISQERKILSLLTRLSKRLQNIPLAPNEEAKKESLLIDFNALKAAITRQHFDAEHLGALDLADDMLSEIYLSSIQLEDAVLDLRNLCYKPNNFIIINRWTHPKDQYTKP